MSYNYKILGQLYYGPEEEGGYTPGGYYTYTVGENADRIVAYSRVPGVVLYSSDGATWTLGVPVTTGTFQKVNSITHGNGAYVGVGNYGAVYSTDGISWFDATENIATVTQRRQSVLFTTNFQTDANGAWPAPTSVFLATRPSTTLSAQYVDYSSDGVRWYQGANLPTANYWSLLAYGNGKYVSLPSSGTYVATATTPILTGANWTQTATGLSSKNWTSIAFGNGIFVARESGGYYATTDAVTWTVTSPGAGVSAKVSFANNLFFAVTGASIYVSTNGTTWTTAYNTAPSIAFTIDDYFAPEVVYPSILKKYILIGSYNRFESTDGYAWTYSGSPFAGKVSPYTYPEAGISLATAPYNTLREVLITIGGQGTPGSYVEYTTPQVIYTVPPGLQTIVTSIFFTNHDTVQRTYDLAIVPAGETLALKHHIRWDAPAAASDISHVTTKITMSAGDKIYVFPSTSLKVGFTALGVEDNVL